MKKNKNYEQLCMNMDDLFDNRKYYADLLYWDGHKETIEIKKKFISDIVNAVEGQYTFVNNESGLVVYGGSIFKVDIYTI